MKFQSCKYEEETAAVFAAGVRFQAETYGSFSPPLSFEWLLIHRVVIKDFEGKNCKLQVLKIIWVKYVSPYSLIDGNNSPDYMVSLSTILQS